MTTPDAFAGLKAEVDAYGATLRAVLATLVLRGVLTRIEVEALLRDTQKEIGGEAGAAVATLAASLPGAIRAAVGPEPDPDDDDH